MTQDKRALRREMKAQRLAIKPKDRVSKEAIIIKEVQKQINLTPHGLIGIYYPFNGEVDISPLWSEGSLIGSTHSPRSSDLRSRLVFPSHQPRSVLNFIKPHAWDRSHKLPLPVGPTVALHEISLLFIPGLAFCPQTGIRLGLGGGHYDRTLAHYAQSSWTLQTFGVGFNFQLRSDIPREHWDIPLDTLITESGSHTLRLDM